MAYDLLEGIKVVELSMYAFAPVSAAVLSDWGAEVIKVVPPRNPDTLMGNVIGGLPEHGRRRGLHVGDHEPGQAVHRCRRLGRGGP